MNPKASTTTLEVLRALRDAKIIKDPDRRVLEALILRGEGRRNFASCPSYADIAAETLMHPKTVAKAISALRKADLMRVGLAPKSNYFYVNVQLILELAKRSEARPSSMYPQRPPNPFASRNGERSASESQE